MQERYDRGGAERRQRNKQGRMEEETNQATPDDKPETKKSNLKNNLQYSFVSSTVD